MLQQTLQKLGTWLSNQVFIYSSSEIWTWVKISNVLTSKSIWCPVLLDTGCFFDAVLPEKYLRRVGLNPDKDDEWVSFIVVIIIILNPVSFFLSSTNLTSKRAVTFVTSRPQLQTCWWAFASLVNAIQDPHLCLENQGVPLKAGVKAAIDPQASASGVIGTRTYNVIHLMGGEGWRGENLCWSLALSSNLAKTSHWCAFPWWHSDLSEETQGFEAA